MNQQRLQGLIQRYQNGTATDEERRQLDGYWQKSLQDESALQNMTAQERDELEQRLWQGTIQQIQQEEYGAFRPVVAIGRPRRWLILAASVTGLLLLLTLGWFWYSSTSTTIAYQTEYGQRHRVVLPDGSVVWLNGHSAIRYKNDWRGDREVWLEGEALFSVTHTANHRKFRVHTRENLTVEVLGTVFNIADRRGNVSVVLRSGSVRLTDQTHHIPDIQLKPGEMVATRQGARPGELRLQKIRVQAELATAWYTGNLLVENKPLGEIFDWLEDTYGIEVDCPETIRQETFAGSIPTDSFASFFDKLEKIYPIHIKKDGKRYQVR